MPSLASREPYIAQTDARADLPIRCGAAAIQSMLYGRDDALFDPRTSSTLAKHVRVHDDQDRIWTAIEAESQALVHSLGKAGTRPGELICEPHSVPPCWSTHPTVMASLLRRGVNVTSGHLAGIASVAEREIDEKDVLGAIKASLGRGVGTAILVGSTHWVVAYKWESKPGGEDDVYYHDPMVHAETVWKGIDELERDVVDAGRRAEDPGTQTAVVGDFAGVTAKVAKSRVRKAAGPPHSPERRSSHGQVTTLREHHAPGFMTQILEHVARSEDADVNPRRALVLPVRNTRKAFASYYLVDLEGKLRVLVDGRTFRSRVAARVRGPHHTLPRLLSAVELSEHVHGESVPVDGAAVTLDRHRVSVHDELVWQYCDQSYSAMLPFYVVQQPRRGSAAVDTIHVRADGKVVPTLTRSLRGV